MNCNFDIKRVQTRLLEMAVAIADILEKHDLPYMIAFGTLLGAVRHRGFIPWDDDFDFFLFSDRYDAAIKVLRAELPATMFLEDMKSEPRYFHNWAHVKDIGTNCQCEHYPQDSLYSHHGLSVDLYKITKIPAADFSLFRYNQAIDYIERRKALGLITAEDYNQRRQSYENRQHNDCITNQNATEILAYPFDIGHQSLDAVFPLKRYDFAGHFFWGPQDAHRILSERYGDYLTLPPEEQRRPHYSEVHFL